MWVSQFLALSQKERNQESQHHKFRCVAIVSAVVMSFHAPIFSHIFRTRPTATKHHVGKDLAHDAMASSLHFTAGVVLTACCNLFPLLQFTTLNRMHLGSLSSLWVLTRISCVVSSFIPLLYSPLFHWRGHPSCRNSIKEEAQHSYWVCRKDAWRRTPMIAANHTWTLVPLDTWITAKPPWPKPLPRSWPKRGGLNPCPMRISIRHQKKRHAKSPSTLVISNTKRKTVITDILIGKSL